MRVFVAAPMTGWCEAHRTALRDSLKAFIESLVQKLHDAGHECFLAHHIENYGLNPREGSVCTPFDFLEMRRSDLVIAFPATSGGVHMELGWASALRKPTIVVACGQESPLALGIGSLVESDIITTTPSFLTDPDEVARVTDAILDRIPEAPSVPPSRHVAFITTGFGFGPAAKAVAIAKEFRRQEPSALLDFFGSGIDHDFGICSNIFDRVIRYDVDDISGIPLLIDHLALYDDVVSVMNFHVAEGWRHDIGRLHIVDSLAWMWPECPAGAQNATHYFIQRYLVDEARLRTWGTEAPVHPVGPICREHPPDLKDIEVDSGLLLVNLSGCANPLIGQDLYVYYAGLLSRWILAEADGVYDRVTICVQQGFAENLKRELGRTGVEIAHLSPDDFTRRLAAAGRVLTSPGITTTLEAHALRKQPFFLLAQNYSQALLNERNLALYPERVSMAFSQLGRDCVVQEGLPEDQGMALVVDLLRRVSTTETEWIRSKIKEMLSAPCGDAATVSDEAGQQQIVYAILASGTTDGPIGPSAPSRQEDYS